MDLTSDEASPPPPDISSLRDPTPNDDVDNNAIEGFNTNVRSSPPLDGASDTSPPPGPPDRPNRWLGPASTYFDYVQPERALLHSLTQQRANDLSIHLYNAHALKARLRDPDLATTDLKSYNSKKHWIRRNDDGSLPWYSKDYWTAWPMSAEDVPREGERFGVPWEEVVDADGLTWRMRANWRPEAEMEEEVLALMLRLGKEQWRERVKDGVAKEDVVVKEQESEVETEDDDLVVKVESGAELDDETEEDHEIGDEHLDEQPEQPFVEPAFLADDDEASRILQPMVSNIMSKLDDLLIGLQKSNKGRQRSAHGVPRSGSRKPRPRSKKDARSKSRARTQADEDDDEGEPGQDEGEDGASDPTTDESHDDSALPTRPKRRKRHHALNPRDWSEVLATASLTGWSPAVVQRTAARCAALFGETAGFGLLDSDHHNTVEPPTDLTQHEPAATTDFVVNSDEEDAIKWWWCPVSSCKRKEEPFRHGFRWREHLRRVHKYSAADVKKVEDAIS